MHSKGLSSVTIGLFIDNPSRFDSLTNQLPRSCNKMRVRKKSFRRSVLRLRVSFEILQPTYEKSTCLFMYPKICTSPVSARFNFTYCFSLLIFLYTKFCNIQLSLQRATVYLGMKQIVLLLIIVMKQLCVLRTCF